VVAVVTVVGRWRGGNGGEAPNAPKCGKMSLPEAVWNDSRTPRTGISNSLREEMNQS
jgi:hypothetical protein